VIVSELSAGAQTGQFAGGDLYIIVTLNLVITLRYHPLYVITRAVKRADATPLDKIFEAGSCCDWLMYVLVDELTSGLYRIVDAVRGVCVYSAFLHVQHIE
jgi:Mg2+ and Co2+ transporter CorA